MKMKTSRIMSVFAVLLMISASVACVIVCTENSVATGETGDTVDIYVEKDINAAENAKLKKFIANGKGSYETDGTSATLKLFGSMTYITEGKTFNIKGGANTSLTMNFNDNVIFKSTKDVAIYSENPNLNIQCSEGKKVFVTGIRGTNVEIVQGTNIESIGHSVVKTDDFPNGISFGIMADQLIVRQKSTVNAIGGDVDEKLTGAISAGLVLLSNKNLTVEQTGSLNCIGKKASKSYGILNENESINIRCGENNPEPTYLNAYSTDDTDGYGISTGKALTIRYGNTTSMCVAGSKYALNITNDNGNGFTNGPGSDAIAFAISLSGGESIVNKDVTWETGGGVETAFTIKHCFDKDGTESESPQNLNDMIKKNYVYGEMSRNLYTVNIQAFDSDGNAYFQPIQYNKTETSFEHTLDTPERGEGYIFVKWTVYDNKEKALVETDNKVTLTNASAFYVQISDWKYEIEYLPYNTGKPISKMTEEVYDGKYTIKEVPEEIAAGYFPKYITGWKINDEGTVYHAGDKIDVTGPVKLVAQWSAHINHTIYYQLDSDSKEPMMTEHTYKNTWILSEPIMKKDGYKFVGWAVNGDEKNIVKAGATLTLTDKTIILVGVWEKNASPEPAPEQKNTDNAPWIVLLVCAVVVLLVAGVAYYFYQQKKKA